MKKTNETAELASQLAGSVFFRKKKEAGANQPTSKDEQKQQRKSVKQKMVRHSPLGTPLSPSQEPEIKENNRTMTPNERTDESNGLAERSTLLSELEEGVPASKRRTERYSFEIFIDQKGRIEDLQYRYKKKTGRKLSSSRIIREALDEYLEKAEGAL